MEDIEAELEAKTIERTGDEIVEEVNDEKPVIEEKIVEDKQEEIIEKQPAKKSKKVRSQKQIEAFDSLFFSPIF